VIVGGGVAQMGDLLLQPIRLTIQDRSMKGAADAVEITAAVLGRRAPLMGAVSQALSLALHQMADGNLFIPQLTKMSQD
jgi:glucokinase